MVVDLCQPHFNTIIHCNKLCADGYDVTNLVSADPALRRRGFKLEYFLRPPVQVTLKFGFQVELCRVDVEMWPWGLDKGQTCKKLEISTSSDRIPSSNFGSSHKQNQQKDKQMQDQEEQKRRKQNHGSKFHQRNGHQWSLQAQQLGEEAQPESQQTDRMFKYQSNPMPSNPESEFKLVGRCEIREGTRVCFTRSNFRPRPPFPSLPPPKPSNCWQEELWSRGPLTLGAVTQLRVNMPFGGAASALGLKALVVWGQPARCCTREEVERIKKVHEDSEKLLPRPVLFASSVTQTKHQQANPNPSNLSIPEEFLDPITQEVMTLPMLLPNGVSVDNTTLEEHQKREATWGRPPNDPFTGVPFTSSSYPLPNPHLKNRIDHFFLQTGMMKRDGILGRREEAEDPQASRLVVCNISGQTENMSCFSKSSTNNTAIQYKAGPRNINCIIQKEENGLRQSKNGIQTFNSQPVAKNSRSILERKSKIDLHRKSTVGLTVEKDPLSQTKRPRLSFDHTSPAPSCSSHEQRLSASLDEALFSALEGRPSFTSNLTQQRSVTPELEPPNISQNSRAVGSHGTPTGQRTCSSCSCSVSVYSKSTLSIYRLTCDHLLCHSCLKQKPQPLNSVTIPTSSHILCPACHSPTPRSDIVRVHH